MTIPKQIKIGPTWFSVRVTDDTGKMGTTGYYPSPRICIDPGFDRQTQVQTLVHEVLHGVLYTVGHKDLSDDEGFVERLANSLATTLLESPGLLEYLMDVRDYE